MAYIGKEPGSGLRGRFVYTATAGQTSFTGADSLGRTLTYTDGEYTDVFLNGVKLDKTDYTATSGTSIVLDSGASADDTLEILAFDTFGLFSGEFAQDVSVGGDLTVDTNTLHVDSANNRVGVGTASPAFALDVQSTGDPAQIRLKEDGNTNGIKIVNFDGDEAQINNVDNGPLVIKTNDTERMRITNAGFVGVGTSSPETPIEIRTTNKLGGTFTGTTDGEGLRVTQTDYTAGNYVSLVEAPYDDSQTAANVRIAGMFDGGGSNLAFGTSNSYGSGITNTAMFIHSSGNVQLSGGLSFAGNDAETAANLQDDYEEGTWTPVHGGNNMTQNTPCRYTKIGRAVFLTIDVTSASGSSATHAITGLPFTPGGSFGALHVAFATGDGIEGGYIGHASDQIILIVGGTNTTDTLNAGSRIIGAGLFFT
jgi:hypothetical protein